MYDETRKRLWECASGECFNCSQYTPTTNASVCQKELMKQAADAIEELSKDRDSWKATAKVEREAYWHWFDQYQKDVPRWIPVTERLPEIRKVVLITDGVDVGTGWVNKGWWNTSFADIQRDAVTHWMPLPQAPKEET